MSIYLPEPLLVSYQTMAHKLAIPMGEVKGYDEQSGELDLIENRYSFSVWKGIFSELHGEQAYLDLRRAYHHACLGATHLDRWKMKLENYPAWARRLPEVRHIDAHTSQIMSEAFKEQHRREAVGLALARMETIERKTKKCARLNFAIVGEARFLGNKVWRENLEDMLPKGLKYRFAYSYTTLLLGSNIPKQLFLEMVDFKPVLYNYYDGIWSMRTFSGFDGVIWVGDDKNAPQTNKPLICCSEKLTLDDKKAIMQMYKALKEKKAY